MSAADVIDEAVEIGAKALYDHDLPHGLLTWATAVDGLKIRYRQAARAVLVAAAPAMLAAERERIAQAIEAMADQYEEDLLLDAIWARYRPAAVPYPREEPT